MNAFVASLAALAVAGASDGSQFEGKYRCASMFGGNILTLALTRSGDQQVVQAKRYHGPSKREFKIITDGIVKEVTKTDGTDPKEEWVFALEKGFLEIDVTATNSLNIIVNDGREQLAFWPCIKSNLEPSNKK